MARSLRASTIIDRRMGGRIMLIKYVSLNYFNSTLLLFNSSGGDILVLGWKDWVDWIRLNSIV